MKTYDLGRFQIGVAFREVGDDRGVAMHVYGPVGDQREEILRFDCFEKQPHYHLAWSYEKRPYIPIDADDAVGWALQKLETSVGELLGDAGAAALTAEESGLFAAQMPRIAEEVRALAATHARPAA